MKSILIFQKWTKINVQKWKVKKVLTDENFHFCVWTFIVTIVIIRKIFMIEKF